MKKQEIKWLSAHAANWLGAIKEGRRPHAVLLLGPAGTGKRALASWMSKRQLLTRDPTSVPEYPFDAFHHADLRWIRPLEDKHTIGVDQIRQLGADLSLTSYEGRGKVAIIEPADVMTANAANSLLKSLEEPAGDTLIILIADRVGKLPATIFSRCQRLNVNCPPLHEGDAWLNAYQFSDRWPEALHRAAGAPILAITTLEQLAETDVMITEFAGVAERSALPLAVAGRWAKYDPAFVLDWLCGQIIYCIHRAFGNPTPGAEGLISDSVLTRIDTRNLFCYLDMVNRLRSQAVGSFNVQLTFESLLIDWAQGLQTVNQSGREPVAGLSFMNGHRK